MEADDRKPSPRPRPGIARRGDSPSSGGPGGVERRAQRLSPVVSLAGIAIVVDTWPLMRAGIRQMLQTASFRVAAEDASGVAATASAGGTLDLAVLGVTREPLIQVVQHIRGLQRPDDASSPHVVVLLERVQVTELRELLAAGVTGVLQRTVNMDDLDRACTQVMAGQRVLSGGSLSVLASAGLEISEPATSADDDVETALLTPKESAVLGHLANNWSNAQIADEMHLSEATIKTHLSNIYAKLDVPGRREAVVEAVQQGLLG